MTIIFLVIPMAAVAQLDITASAGYGTFRMRDMATFQTALRNDLPVDARITSSFPSFWNFEISAIRWDGAQLTGLGVNCTSTGGRVYYSDYSGMVRMDQLLSSIGVDGIIGTRIGNENDKYVTVAQLRGGILMTRFNFEVEEAVGSLKRTEVLKFKSISAAFQPTLTVTRNFDWIGIQALAGYHFTLFPGKLYKKDDDKAYLMTTDKTPLKADWSGFRVSLGVAFRLRQ